MRKWFASLAALSLVTAAASAQTIPNISCWPQFGYDSAGSSGNAWKIGFPSIAGGKFNVDFNADLAGLNVIGMSLGLDATSNGGALGQVAFCTSNFGVDATGTTPDTVGGVISGVAAATGGIPTTGMGFCPGFVGYDLADFTGGTDVHGVMQFATGDSAIWLCTDTAGAVGRSYFTTNNYATQAIPFTVNWEIRAVFGGAPGTFTINGRTANSVRDDSPLSFEFWGPAPTQYLQGLAIGLSFIAIPGFVLPTGFCNFVPPGTGPNNGSISGTLAGACPPVGSSFNFYAFYLDPTNLKPNGHPSIQKTNTANFTVTSGSKSCNPLPCFGVADDGVAENFWKVYPAPAGDFFSVKLGKVPATGVTNLLSMQAAYLDSIGNGVQLKAAGVYKSNLGLDPTGNTPDVSTSISSVSGAAAAVAPGVAQWGYPATTFDFADVAATPGSPIHLGVSLPTGDTGMWLGGDSDGADDPNGSSPNDCGVIPNTTSFFTTNNFTTTAIPFTFANNMERLDWN